jgi:hypothetical protein
MDIPETYKDIEINDRKFRLNKMNARTGSYLIFKLMKILSPMFKNIKEDSNDINISDLNLTELASKLFDLPEEDFRFIQDNALQVIQEILPGGQPPVLNKRGEFEALNVEFDTPLVMNLTIQSLVFNVKGFFKGGPLDSIMKGQSISQLNLKI